MRLAAYENAYAALAAAVSEIACPERAKTRRHQSGNNAPQAKKNLCACIALRLKRELGFLHPDPFFDIARLDGTL